MELTQETKVKTSLICGLDVDVITETGDRVTLYYEHQELKPFKIKSKQSNAPFAQFDSMDDLINSLGTGWTAYDT